MSEGGREGKRKGEREGENDGGDERMERVRREDTELRRKEIEKCCIKLNIVI